MAGGHEGTRSGRAMNAMELERVPAVAVDRCLGGHRPVIGMRAG